MAYPSDLTDKQWQKIEHFFDNGNYGNRQKWDKRLLMNAVLYLLKSGCQWRMLPRDFPPYKTEFLKGKRRILLTELLILRVQKQSISLKVSELTAEKSEGKEAPYHY